MGIQGNAVCVGEGAGPLVSWEEPVMKRDPNSVGCTVSTTCGTDDVVRLEIAVPGVSIARLTSRGVTVTLTKKRADCGP